MDSTLGRTEHAASSNSSLQDRGDAVARAAAIIQNGIKGPYDHIS
jgi:hypothetical protein